MLPLRARLVPILAVLDGAPICAEYLQAYLASTGQALQMLGGLLILGPLYGGAALLIREISLRSGRGWRGTLLLAAAFGLTMTALVDLSLWTQTRGDVPYWNQIQQGTRIEAWGIALNPLLSWVLGHVAMSIGVPLALLAALAPQHCGRPLLGRLGLVVVASLMLAAMVLIHGDSRSTDNVPSPTQLVVTLVGLIALTGLAFSRVGRPLRPAGERPPPSAVTALTVAVVASTIVEFSGLGWSSIAVISVTWVAVAAWVLCAGRRPGWSVEHITALAVGALATRCVIGMLAPLPPGVTLTSKLVQSALFLVLALIVSVFAWRTARTGGGPAGGLS